MHAGLLDMLHDAGDEGVLAVGNTIDVDFDRIRQVAVEQERALLRHHEFGRPVEVAGETGEITIELMGVVHDLHRPPAQHIGRPDHDRETHLGGNRARFAGRGGDGVLRLFQAEFVEQLLEAVAIFGEIDHVGRGAEDRHVRLFERFGELQRRLAAELHDHAVQGAAAALDIDDLEHVFGGERFEIQAIRGVVIGRHRFRIAIDHDGLVARILQREAGMAAAIIELDALADAVRPAAQDHDLFLVGGRSLVRERARERRLIGRIHIGRGGGEFGSAGVDPLEYRTHVERVALLRHLGRRHAGELGKARVGKSHRLQPPQRARRRRQSARLDRFLGLDDAADLRQEPRIDLAAFMDEFVVHAEPHRLSDLQQTVGRRRADGGADGIAVVAFARSLDCDVIEAGQAGLERAQRLLQRIPGNCGRSPSPRRPISSRWSAYSMRRGISRRRNAGSW